MTLYAVKYPDGGINISSIACSPESAIKNHMDFWIGSGWEIDWMEHKNQGFELITVIVEEKFERPIERGENINEYFEHKGAVHKIQGTECER